LRFVLFLLLAGVAPGRGETRGAMPAPIILYTQFAQAPSDGVRHALQAEVETIMSPLGLRFEWHDGADPEARNFSGELVIITFEGRCDPEFHASTGRAAGPLGWTHMLDGQVQPFTNLACDRVREMLQPVLVTRHSTVREAILGRALGRVLAHELYHIFARTAHHGSCGIAKQSYSVWDLVDTDFRFDAKEFLLLRNTLRTGI
jgi:hypothetical protein